MTINRKQFQLRKPCLNCPFSVADTRIKFTCRERAVEIEEHAYRNGFPCHLSATIDDEDDDAGFEFGPGTQHCVGHTIMRLNDDDDTWPGIGNEDLPDWLYERLAGSRDLAFESAEAFFQANETDTERLERKGERK